MARIPLTRSIDNLCLIIRRPGGTVPDPLDDEELIPNLSFTISLVAQTNLKLLCFFLCHSYRTLRLIKPRSINLIVIQSIRKMRLFEFTYVAPTEPPKVNQAILSYRSSKNLSL